jgi:hypothetical protein
MKPSLFKAISFHRMGGVISTCVGSDPRSAASSLRARDAGKQSILFAAVTEARWIATPARNDDSESQATRKAELFQRLLNK